MAARLLSSTASPQILPRILSSSSPNTRSSISSSFLSRYVLTPVTISLTIPGFLSDIWESVLRAVPKKKTSHMKKRHRQMAGKALKDVKSLNTCPACGNIKRAHVLCPHCVEDIKKQWTTKTA